MEGNFLIPIYVLVRSPVLTHVICMSAKLSKTLRYGPACAEGHLNKREYSPETIKSPVCRLAIAIMDAVLLIGITKAKHD